MRALPALLLLTACGGGGGNPLIDAAVPDARRSTDAMAPTCTPASGTSLALEPVVSGLEFPLLVTSPPGDRRLFVVEKDGRIRIVDVGTLRPAPFLDLTGPVRSTGDEEGLLGLAFHPDYAQNGRFFVYYTADDPDGDNVLAEYQVSADPDLAQTVERRLLVFAHPRVNHNGGNIVFGPDGYLYIGTGDGGGAGDPEDNAQDPTSLLGKLLRIDVDSGDPYGIPADNPYAASTGAERKEIWALGLRNPWRWSFDRQTGDLYIGDVGQDDREEVDVEPAGGAGGVNYGWDLVEGECCFPVDAGLPCSSACPMTGLTAPVVTYLHGAAGGCAVTGGYVYRGTCLPDIAGWYFYADHCRNRVWTIVWPGELTPTERTADLGTAGMTMGISSFGEDATGELYLVSRVDGTVYRIVADPP